MVETESISQIEEDCLNAEICQESFYEFFKEFWGEIEEESLVDNWHIEYICEELQIVAENLFQRKPKLYDLIINIPPGTTKSTICTVMFPAWCWCRDPSIRTLTNSYSSSLSINHATKSRDLIQSDKYRRYFGNIELKDDQNNKSNYKNTSGGQRIATSTGGASTGNHAHFIINDDPVNPKQALSDAERKTANNHIDHTLSTRKVDKKVSVSITVMQRVHEDDPTGHMLAKNGRIKHICLPGELSDRVKPEELKERYADNLLDPLRLDRETLTDLKIDLGSYGYSGQIQQSPSPEGGGIWQKWFIPVPDREMDDLIHTLRDYGTDWDTAYTKDDANSASAFVTSGKKGNDIYLDKAGYDFKEFPDLIRYMSLQPAPHYIEKKASGKSAKQTLTNAGINAIEVEVTGGDKQARARMATPTAEAGRVYVRASLLDFIYNDDKQGILKFPNASHDDLQDAVTQSIQRHSKARKPLQTSLIDF